MKKAIAATFAGLFLCTAAWAQTRADYDAVLGKFQQYYNQEQPDSIYTLMAERIQKMMPADKTRDMMTKLSADFGKLQAYTYQKQDDRFTYYKTVFAKKTMVLVTLLNKDNKLENFRFAPYKEDTQRSNIVLSTPTGDIYGTLTLPNIIKKKVPVVLIIAGSGPTDRSGNNPMGVTANTYLMIANELQKEGIACVRYDKRGIGESMAGNEDESKITFDDMINDAVGYIHMLKEDGRFTEVIVAGHSEGSLIGMVAARKGNADKYISIAGLGERADRVIKKQLAAQSKDMAAKAGPLMDSIIAGYTVHNTDPSLEALFRPSVVPYLRSWMKYIPKTEFKKLNMKTLVLQGTTDLQVDEKQANILIEAKPDTKHKIIEGMNHVLKDAPVDRQQNLATYADPNLPLNHELIPMMTWFINGK